MSEESKQAVKKAKQFYQEVSEQSKRFQQIIPDKKLAEKLRKVDEHSKEVVHHIEEHQG